MRYILACGSLIAIFAPFDIAHAGSYAILYEFSGRGGANPMGGLLADQSGNLYGTTTSGGRGCRHSGCGTLFQLAPDGTETVLHDFGGKGDGRSPLATLIANISGSLFGTTFSGGDKCGMGKTSCGTVFAVAPDGTETVLYRFNGKNGEHGAFPFGALVLDKSGDFFGTTNAGGNTSCGGIGCGTVFKLAADGKQTVLHAFSGGSDGAYPVAGLLENANTLYGVAGGGGNGNGTVFKITKDGAESVLYAFAGGDDGATPDGALIADKDGNLYGTTADGGNGCALGCGTVFKLAPDGTETVLYAFKGGSDGAEPLAGLVVDASGNLFGTTYVGGGSGCGGGGCGTAFELATDGTETVLHAFAGGSDGAMPQAGSLVFDSEGNLYGTTFSGGNGHGTVFELKPN
jgi:uncharacterized repeat protein (TIGR03803 family)